LKESRFRDRFDAVVVAIRRGHERLEGGLGNITLAAGDTLILVPGKRFESERRAHRKEFVVINDLDSSARLDANKSSLVLLGFASVIGCALLDVIPLIKGLAAYLIA
ncbi:TrkA C-terminal domain-containing protein, partial [Vibrio astriarenae]